MLGLTQPLTDSTQSVEVPRWRLWRLIHEVQLGRACDSLRHQLEKEITYGVNAQVKADSVITAQRRQIDLRDQAVKVQGDRVMNYAKDNQELRREIRRQKGLTLAVGLLGVVMVLIAL